MAGFFALFSAKCYLTAEVVCGTYFLWTVVTFFSAWGLHKAKVSLNKDYTRVLLRDTPFKYALITLLFFPFFLIRYLSLIFQSFAEQPVSRITDHLFIGQQPFFLHHKTFRDNGINAVLDVTIEGVSPWFILGNKAISYLKIPILDKTSPNMILLDEGVDWAAAQMKQGRNLYVHCGGGRERSALFASAILMKLGIEQSLEGAMTHIRRIRPKVRLLESQQRLLEDWIIKRSL